MAESKQADNRWLYVAGVVVLAVLVVIGLVWGGGDRTSEPGPDAGAADGGGSGEAADAATAGERDGAATEGADAATAEAPLPLTTEGEEPVVEPIPEDPDECRAYCERLAERGELGEGATVQTCVAQACRGEGTPDASPTTVPTISSLPEPPDDCRAQCRALSENGELREGTTLEDCYEALCSSGEEEEEE